jgi:hypothetical protein
MLDFIAKWIVLVLFFLFLTYLFRDRFTLEGFAGYALIVFVLVPINVAARKYVVDSPHIAEAHENALAIVAASLLFLNLFLMFLLNRFLPGVTISSIGVMIAFAVLFTAGGVLVGYLPSLPSNLIESLGGSASPTE